MQQFQPGMSRDPEYRKAIAWVVGGLTASLILLFTIPSVAVLGIVVALFIATPKYLKVRKRYIIKS